MFIDEWFRKDFYKQLPLGFHSQFCFGQIFWTHAYYPHENLELWRPVQAQDEPTKTISRDFRIEPARTDAFKRSLPIHTPKLETNEEFIVIRAKVRPVILVQSQIPIAGVDNKGYSGRIERRRCIVAQVFGLSDTKTEKPAFNPSFVNRVRTMEFPQFMFLPKHPEVLAVDSFLRLDELQSVFTPHLDPTPVCLSDDVASILKDQIEYLITSREHNSFIELREMLLSS